MNKYISLFKYHFSAMFSTLIKCHWINIKYINFFILFFFQNKFSSHRFFFGCFIIFLCAVNAFWTRKEIFSHSYTLTCLFINHWNWLGVWAGGGNEEVGTRGVKNVKWKKKEEGNMKTEEHNFDSDCLRVWFFHLYAVVPWIEYYDNILLFDFFVLLPSIFYQFCFIKQVLMRENSFI